MKKIKNFRYFLSHAAFSLVLVALLLSACSLPEVHLPFKTASLAQVEPFADNADALPTPVSNDAPLPEETARVEPATSTSGELTGQDSLSGLVVFTSTSNDPFARSDAGKVILDPPARHLWGITPDGELAGRLSDEGADTALVDASKPEGKVLVIASGVENPGESMILVSLPDECRGNQKYCTDYQFGLKGRTYAYLSGEESCGRNLTLVERATGVVLQTWQHVSWYRFNQDGGMLLALDDCSSRYVYQYIPNTGAQSGMASDGEISWDPSRKAALVQLKGSAPVLSALWGFNLQTSSAILWPEQGQIMQDSPTWLDDGRHFVYQHRSIGYDKNSGNAYLEGPRQVILMDAWTRAQHLLAFNTNYDFHLCPTEGETCQQPYGDWLRVTRTPFHAGGLKLGDPGEAVTVRCALYGLDCAQPAEEFALNWRTGELIPWSEAGLTEAQPAPAFPPPNLGTEPVYSDPAGSFYLYTSADGHSLWYVPLSGDPELWVTEGEDFVFLP